MKETLEDHTYASKISNHPHLLLTKSAFHTYASMIIAFVNAGQHIDKASAPFHPQQISDCLVRPSSFLELRGDRLKYSQLWSTGFRPEARLAENKGVFKGKTILQQNWPKHCYISEVT
ncbi:hypothetical protein [Pontiella desulfatans]|uniref:hypothetical protein n=1 Tax=Pontiella desulfatans TaxID=2750659 RepID=UPI00109C6829|nr:hypothetical protein [Pontiella desulfatans]